MDIDDSESPIPPYSTLLSNPGSKHFSQEKSRIESKLSSVSSVPESADWSLVRKTRQFSRQYAHTYFVRLLSMRDCLKEKVEKEWAGIPLKPIAELCESSSTSHASPSKDFNKRMNGKGWNNLDETVDENSEGSHEQHIALREDITVAIIGTIFKQQPDKPSILQELVDEIEIRSENDAGNFSKKANFVSDKDILVMEDQTTRVRLIPSSHVKKDFSVDGLVNGIVCAVKGKPNIDGKFEVTDIIWATPKPSVWPKAKNCGKSKMIFVSGLHLGQIDINTTQIGLLFEFLEGLCGSELEQENITGEISRVFFVGNSFANTIQDPNSISSGHSASDKFVKIAEISKKLDNLLCQLAKTMEVYIISGKTDPVEAMYPQPPINRCLFPQSSQYSNFHLLSNPTRLELNVSNKSTDQQQLLDTIFMDGEPILDIMRYSDIRSCPIEVSRKILQWGHLCPTTPDTLPLHPGVDTDIFILKSLPNLFIVGNQKEFNVSKWNETQIITLPTFSQTNTIGVFTTNDFNCSPIEFNLML